MIFLNDFLVFLLFHSVIIQINKTKEKVTEVKKISFFTAHYLILLFKGGNKNGLSG